MQRNPNCESLSVERKTITELLRSKPKFGICCFYASSYCIGYKGARKLANAKARKSKTLRTHRTGEQNRRKQHWEKGNHMVALFLLKQVYFIISNIFNLQKFYHPKHLPILHPFFPTHHEKFLMQLF